VGEGDNDVSVSHSCAIDLLVESLLVVTTAVCRTKVHRNIIFQMFIIFVTI